MKGIGYKIVVDLLCMDMLHMGVASGCGEQGAGVACGSGWNLCM